MELLNNVYFDKDAHTYYADEARTEAVPNYSFIIGEVLGNKFNMVPYEIRRKALAKGSAVHRNCEIEDSECFMDYDSKYDFYTQQWKQFKEDAGIKSFVLIEQPMLSKEFWFATTPDRITEDGVLIEIKTGQYYKEHALQTASQKIAVEENAPIKIKKRMAVYLNDYGYTTKVFDNPEDMDIWKSIIKVYQFKEWRK